MKNVMKCIGLTSLLWGFSSLSLAQSGVEMSCSDGIDNDQDSMVDCADADCKNDIACQPGQGSENTNAACSDWVDNDGDGYLDCDDSECSSAGVDVCQGSWDKIEKSKQNQEDGQQAQLPAIPDGASIEDLLGKGSDADGERNDVVCSDGIDNDGDGFTDCADLGCRFDPTVVVCRDSPGLRLAVTAHASLGYDASTNVDQRWDARFSMLKVRAFGPLPFIDDSFFLISMRTEKTPRLTFAMFQLPLGGGHMLNVNSGGGGLSFHPVRSEGRQMLLDKPYYMYSAFDQGSGVNVEFQGPIVPRINYRAFISGGSGQFNGNIGGRFFSYDNDNFQYSVGGQVFIDIIGHTSRWDYYKLFTPVPTALSISLGAKYDQRAQERYPAVHTNITFKTGPFIAEAEAYVKRELEFESWQIAYRIAAGVLVVDKTLFIAADFGEFRATEMNLPPAVAETDIRKLRNQREWRAGVHWYIHRNNAILSVIYTGRQVEDTLVDGVDDGYKENGVRLVGQYRF